MDVNSHSHLQVVDSPRETVTAHRYAEAYQSLVERSGMCIALVDLGLRIVEANEHFREELGGPHDVVGRELADYLHQSSHPLLGSALNRMVEGRSPRAVERVFALRKGDQMAPAQLTAVAVRNEHPIFSMIVVLLQWDSTAGPVGRASAHKRILSEIDARILEGVATGMSTVNLAAKLYLSRQGVEYHVGKMLRRLKVANRAALVSRAYATGILSPGTWPPRVAPECIR